MPCQNDVNLLFNIALMKERLKCTLLMILCTKVVVVCIKIIFVKFKSMSTSLYFEMLQSKQAGQKYSKYSTRTEMAFYFAHRLFKNCVTKQRTSSKQFPPRNICLPVGGKFKTLAERPRMLD